MKTITGLVLRLCVVCALCTWLVPVASAQPINGACCLASGQCVSVTQCECDMQGGSWQGLASVCPNPNCASTVFGVCCNPAGCIVTTSALCSATGGTVFQPGQTSCASAPCVGPTVACCCGNVCLVTNPRFCTLAGATIVGTACTPGVCPVVVCCDMLGNCTLIAPTLPCSGIVLSSNTTCTPNPCPPASTNCCNASTGACSNFAGLGCPAGWFGSFAACTPTPCPPKFCCDVNNNCLIVYTAASCNGTINTTITTCTPNPCPGFANMYACCDLAGNCTMVPLGTPCNGTTLSSGTTCVPNNPCPPPTNGACCTTNTTGMIVCNIVSGPAACPPPGLWAGVGTTCSPINPCAPPSTICCNVGTGLCQLVSGISCPTGSIAVSATSCTPNPCPPASQGACCTVNAAGTTVCTIVSGATACPAPGIWGGVGSTCAPTNPCVPPSVLCCKSLTGACQIQSGTTCAPGSIAVTATSCTPNPCPPGTQGACCDPTNGICQIVSSSTACVPPQNFYPGLTCAQITCVPGSGQVCCDPSTGNCTTVPLGTPCPAGTIANSAASCMPNPCPPGGNTGACCQPCTGNCFVATAAQPCTGAFTLVAGATCTPNPCPTGAFYGKCCMNGSCIAATSCDCIKKAGWFLGLGACNAISCAGQVPGACCNPSNNVCSYVSQGTCAQISGTNFTPNTVCSGAAPCNNPIVACCCCNTCTTLDPQVCTLAGGTIQMANSCTPLTCYPNGGACCDPANGTCSIVPDPSHCPAPMQYYPGLTCAQIVCGANSGACCNVCTGNCIITAPTQCIPPQNVYTAGATCVAVMCTPTCGACCGFNTAGTYGCYGVQNAAQCTGAGGTFQGVGSTCAGVTCPPQTGACCGVNSAGVYGCFMVTSASGCTGTFYGLGSSCAGITCPPQVVVCCDMAGNCQVFNAAVCPTTYPQLFPGSSCVPSPCPPPTGACCGTNAAGVYACFLVSNIAACNGTFFGFGSTCAGVVCPPQTVVCCDPITGTCSSVTATTCPAGTVQVTATACNPNPCPPGSQGACCDPSTGLCSIVPDSTHCPAPMIFSLGLTCAQIMPCLVTTTQVCCDPATGACSTATPCPFPNGVVVTASSCTPNPCPRGACCGTNTAGVYGCFIVPSAAACNGTFYGINTTCAGVVCPTTGACCTPCSGACAQTTAAACPGAGMYFPGQMCTPGVCPATVLFGKCCLNGNCATASSCDCVNKGGTWFGPNGTCTAAQCAMELPGACCVTSTQICQQLTTGSCAQIGGSFFPSASCNAIPIQCSTPGSACCCCGACHVQDQSVCQLSGGVFFPGVSCTPYPCNGNPATGACCVPGTTTCQPNVTQANCQGVWFANGVCTPNPCVTACCDPATGMCTQLFASNACPTGTVPYTGQSCSPSPCPPAHVCCDPQTGACSTLVPCPFLNGVMLTTATSCTPNPCPMIVCCDAAGNCGLVATASQCNGTIFPSLASCQPNPCQPTGMCCSPQGCIVSPSQCDCLTQYGGIWVANCNPAVCPTGTSNFFGACCVPNTSGLNSCVQTNANICSQLNGQFFPNQTCPLAGGCTSQPVACCCPVAGTCNMVDAALCNLAGGIPVSASSCNPNPCNPGHGACCDPATGVCTNVSGASACPASSIYTPNVTCAGAPPCPPVQGGACCTACTGACVTVSSQLQCPSLGSFFANATCNPNPCPAAGTQIFGTCCIYQNCSQVTPCECLAKNGVWYGPNGACNPAACQQEVPGACCDPSTNICSQAAPSTCLDIGGSYGGPSSVCGPAGPFPACKNPAPACCCCGSCHNLDPALCLLGAGTTVYGAQCGPFTCTPGGACCDTNTGLCTIVASAAQCAAPGKTYYNNQTCSQIPPCLQSGACCNLMTGLCNITTQHGCPPPLFTWTAGGSCLPPNAVLCPQTAGACCNYATGACAPVASATACPAPGVFLGVGVPCPVTPCIPPQIVCCNVTSGWCQIYLATACPTGWIPSTASSCLSYFGGPQPCPPVGRCCILGAVSCNITFQSLCNGNWVQGGACTPTNPCVTACCNTTTGGCSQVYIGQLCPVGTIPSPGQTCGSVFCYIVYQIVTCCTPQGGCTMILGSACPIGMTPASGLCGPFGNPCPVYGSCCHFLSPICTQTTQAQCNASGGIWAPASCTPNPCFGACCDQFYGGCYVDMIWKCGPPSIYNPNITCVPSPCPGACCNTATGSCSVQTAAQCHAPNIYLGNGTVCTSTVCHPGVCCYPNAQCIVVASPSQCPHSAYYMPNISTCNPYPCGGACCTLLFSTSGPPVLYCSYTSPLGCIGTWLGPYTTCTPNPCPVVCCNPNGGCNTVPSFACVGHGYLALPGTSSCNPSPCLGACCTPPNVVAYGNTTGTHCVITTAAQCQGQFHGAGTACSAPANTSNLTTCCPANFDGMNGPQVADVFAYLNAWFAGCVGQPGAPCFGANADINGGGLSVSDIFTFLNVWFTGCS